MSDTLAQALEREHQRIDAGIVAFTADGGGETLRRTVRALRRHIYLEEEFLFPPLGRAGYSAPVHIMLREHAQMWQLLDQLGSLVEGGAEDPATRLICRRLTGQLLHHNLKEERDLYPHAEGVLDGPAGEQLSAYLRHGELPDGWVCHGARSRRFRRGLATPDALGT